MTGFLNWLDIENNSPFGAGMWFLTLLLIFYAFFPFLRLLFLNKKRDLVVTVFLLCFSFYCTYIFSLLTPYG